MTQLIKKLPDVPVFVRTTILPSTSDRLSKETGHQVCYMPEFLTERNYIEDFKKQTMVFTGAHELLTKIFVGKKFTVMTPLKAELTKYMHNVFEAYKVTCFQLLPRILRVDGGGATGARYTPDASIGLYQRHAHLPLVPMASTATVVSVFQRMSMRLLKLQEEHHRVCSLSIYMNSMLISMV